MKKIEVGGTYRNVDPAERNLAAAARSIPVVDGCEEFPALREGSAFFTAAAAAEWFLRWKRGAMRKKASPYPFLLFYRRGGETTGAVPQAPLKTAR